MVIQNRSKRALCLLILCLSAGLCFGQPWLGATHPGWIPALSNNAVVGVELGGSGAIYSFGGIDNSKIYSGITNRSFRLELWPQAGKLDTLGAMPDPVGKIACGASLVKGRVYIIGGYHVAQSGAETSSDRVHIFDPATLTYEPDGQALPIPIDDHVQAVWRDSLIYVVTGWSNTGNVPAVQIYNPSADSWMQGTPTPDAALFKVFGASGTIIGDTLYYAGGAADWNGSTFPLGDIFRKGAIDPAQPDSITWLFRQDAAARGYRMGAVSALGKAYWIGGSRESYNFDGIAYNGSGGVEPANRMFGYDPGTGRIDTVSLDSFDAVMDLRGAACLPSWPESFALLGGMGSGQQMTDTWRRIRIQWPLSSAQPTASGVQVYPNPAKDWIRIEAEGYERAELYDLQGVRRVESLLMPNTSALRVPRGTHGLLWLRLIGPEGSLFRKIVVIP